MGLVAAILSSICTALMVVSDRFIIKDYYEGKSEHAWIISSAAGGVFGLALTVIIAFFLSVFTDSVSLTLISAAIYELFFWEGIAMVLVGTFAIQTLYHYFRCYENDVSSPTIASWIATLPLFIMAVYLIAEFFYPNGTEIGGVGPHWFIGIFITDLN